MKTALLLDADIIAFKIASTSQKTYEFPGCEPYTEADDWELVVPRIHQAIDALKEDLKTDLVIVCLSCPTAENWRLDVLPTYKGNRDYSKRPIHLAPVKDYMATTWPSYRRPVLEADDIMGILSTMAGLPPGFLKEHPEFIDVVRKIIVSSDKDMKTIPGWLYNPDQDTKPHLIDQATADRWHLYQTIKGDSTDGYTGCPGAGHEAAEICLGGMHYHSFQHTLKSGPRKGTEVTRWVLSREPSISDWERITALYRYHGYTEEDALVQARVARICRASDYDFAKREVILWTPTSTKTKSTS